MRLNVPLVRQKEDSVDCGLAAVAMVLNYYEIKTNVEKLRKEIKVYKLGTYVPQLGRYLIKKGFKVTMTTLNPYLFTLRDTNLTQNEIAERFKKMLKKEKKQENIKSLKFSLEFIKAGGKIEVKIPGAEDIKNEVKNNRPLIAVLTTNFLTSKRPKFNLHFNVITGIDNQYVFANDSHWDHRGGKKKHLINDFLYGIYAGAHSSYDNGSILKISSNPIRLDTV